MSEVYRSNYGLLTIVCVVDIYTQVEECDVYIVICRDRMAVFWQSIQDHLYSLLVNATEHTFVVERAVVGLLRLTIRLLRRDEIAAQVRMNVLCISLF